MLKPAISLFLFFFCSFALWGQKQAQPTPVQLVDPLIGTGIATTESARAHSEATSEMKAQTFPAVGVPFGMTHWTPQTRTTEIKCISPYYYADTRISGFRGSHWMSGSCTQDYGSLTIMPLTGKLEILPQKYASTFDHKTEKAGAAYYEVLLDTYGIKAQVSGTSRAGYLQFTFPKTDAAYLLITPNSDEGQGFVRVDPAQKEISGYNPVHRIYQGSGKPAGFSGFFVARFEKAFRTFGTFRDGQVQAGEQTVSGNGKQAGAYVQFGTRPGEVIRVKVGTSFTSLEEARRNLEAEIPGWRLETVRRQAEAAWNQVLSRVAIKGARAGQETMFYTALYHAMLLPRVYSDHSGTYPAFATQYQTRKAEGFQYYGDFSAWDTYRAVHPLYTVLAPERTRDMVRTFIAMAEDGGWMPIFPCWNNYTSAMIGDHLASVIADAYVKGIRDFDVAKAYRYLRQNAFEQPQSQEEYRDGKGRRGLSSYLRHGYVPLEDSVWEAFHKREQVSRTLEYAYDDFAVAQLAKNLNLAADYEVLRRRATNYRHVYDPESGYVRGRFANGTWIQSFNPNGKEKFITEGTPWQYTYSVPHDVPGLIGLMGGREQFVRRLDALFQTNQYWHGNEPGHHIPYLYSFAGAPWKTQARVAAVRKEEYGPGPGGISGNDDTGQMSAWYAFSALGFYPVTPGTPYYVIGTPLFPEVRIQGGGGKPFTVLAPGVSDQNIYIQSARLNGQPYDKAYLRHEAIVAGGRLELVMGPRPNPNWASSPDSAPPGLAE